MSYEEAEITDTLFNLDILMKRPAYPKLSTAQDQQPHSLRPYERLPDQPVQKELDEGFQSITSFENDNVLDVTAFLWLRMHNAYKKLKCETTYIYRTHQQAAIIYLVAAM